MLILTHRTNTAAAFRRSLRAGFGAELDVRDAGGLPVVAHDPPRRGAPGLAAFFRLYADLGSALPLALNIKSCGLQKALAALLSEYRIRDYFVFDMAVPDGLEYARRGLRLFARQSEHEPSPALLHSAAGVWYDEFSAGRLGLAALRGHLRAGRRVCAVSPELHGRPYLPQWRKLREADRRYGRGLLLLCTDHPGRAAAYFNDAA